MSHAIKCHIHGVEYDYMNEQCPRCLENRSAYNYVLRRLTCGLCGELKASTTIMCGGPIGKLFQDCRDLIHKWEDAKKGHKAFVEKRVYEAKSRSFFLSLTEKEAKHLSEA